FNLDVGAGGATIDTNGQTVTLGAAVTGSGPITKAGGGRLNYVYPTGNTTDLTSGGKTLAVNGGDLAVNTNGNNVTWAGTIGGPAAATGAFFKQGAGTLTLQQAFPQKQNFFVNQGGVVLDGPAASVTTGGYISVGQATGDNGSLTVQGGAKFTVAGQDFNVSDVAGTTGTLLVTGPGSLAQGPTVFVGKGGAGTAGTATVRDGGALTSTGDLNVGWNTATGRLFIEGGTVTANTLFVGRQATAVGAVRQTGGAVQRGTSGNEWRIGGGDANNPAAVGTYDLSAGTLTAGASNLQVGSYGVGQLTQTGGAVTLSSDFPSVARFTGSNGYLNVLGGTYDNPNAGGSFIVAEQGTGYAVIGGTGVVTVNPAKGVQLGLGAPATTATPPTPGGFGTLVLGTGTPGGGTLSAGRIFKGGGTGRFFFNGGRLVAGGDSATFLEGLTGGTSGAYVQAAGGTIDTNGKTVTINQSLAAPTGNGLATVAVTAGGTGYTTTPVVQITPATGDAGVGATAVATVNASGVVTGITVTNPGTGYAAAPTVTLLGGVPGTAATTGTVALTAAPLASGGITKVGAGTLTLGGANTYAGTTTATAGTLLVNGSLTGGATATTGGTLGGSGTIAGPVSISSATVAPGNSPGRMTVGGLTLAGGAASTLAVEIGGAVAGTDYDQVASTGAVGLGGATLAVTLLNAFVPAAGQQFMIVDNQTAGAITGTFAGIAQGGQVLAGGVPFTVSYTGGTGNDVVLTAVPEPAAVGLFGAAALGLLARRRRAAARAAV
ncbi:MAG: Extracellular serine protease precursor, partial [Phycisphaerales bacterium]|nr:Extracellular serine protease precursor [Phycisphaerales bacterium]